MVTNDGYFEGPGHDLSWHNVDDEFVDFAVRQLDESDTLVMGRKTYELMSSFWPSAQAKHEDPATADRMNGYRKLVFSRTVRESTWNNTTFSDNPLQAIAELKKQPGKDIAVLASSNLSLTLLREHLLDELRLMINPIVLGEGTTLFAGIKNPLRLSLKSSRTFTSGNELLVYSPHE